MDDLAKKLYLYGPIAVLVFIGLLMACGGK